LRINRRGDSLAWFITFFITFVLKDIIYEETGFNYNIVSDNFNIVDALTEVFIYVVCFFPTYYLITYLRKRMKSIRNQE
jgi:hypothetical protein